MKIFNPSTTGEDPDTIKFTAPAPLQIAPTLPEVNTSLVLNLLEHNNRINSLEKAFEKLANNWQQATYDNARAMQLMGQRIEGLEQKQKDLEKALLEARSDEEDDGPRELN